MSQVAVGGCLCQCIYGSLPASLKALSQSQVVIDGKPVCTIQDTTFEVLPPFGICTSPIPPAPVPIPAPCSCVIPPVWPGGTFNILAGNKPVLSVGSFTMCLARAGMITVVSAGQAKAV